MFDKILVSVFVLAALIVFCLFFSNFLLASVCVI